MLHMLLSIYLFPVRQQFVFNAYINPGTRDPPQILRFLHKQLVRLQPLLLRSPEQQAGLLTRVEMRAGLQMKAGLQAVVPEVVQKDHLLLLDLLQVQVQKQHLIALYISGSISI